MKPDIDKVIHIVGILAVIIAACAVKYLMDVSKAQQANLVSLKGQVTTMEGMITKVAGEKSALEADLKAVQAEKENLASALTGYEAQARKMADDIRKMGHTLLTARDKMAKKEKGFKDALAEKDAAIAKLEAKIEAFRAEMARPRDGSRARDLEPEGQGTEAQGALRLEPLVVESRRIHEPIDAKVLDVNKEFNFVVVSAGSDQGIVEGDSLNVMRGAQYLGRMIVERVEADVAVARPIYKSLRDVVKRGDRVSY
ncbi:MAG: hypothetical protein PHS37_00295 [Candidatus Omnitrophica bacterium]|nr:hypothetical protein [Candidatus Omnitrophota bacterium]